MQCAAKTPTHALAKGEVCGADSIQFSPSAFVQLQVAVCLQLHLGYDRSRRPQQLFSKNLN